MKIMFALLVLVTLTSCATKKIEAEVLEKAKQSNVSDSKTLGNEVNNLIQSSKTLKDEQKKELQEIFAANKKKSEELTEQSYRLRGVLVEELLADKLNRKEIKVIKNKIKKIETEKLKNTFDTVEKVSKIVSGVPEEGDFANHMIMIDRPFR